jgi:hypothetical protein
MTTVTTIEAAKAAAASATTATVEVNPHDLQAMSDKSMMQGGGVTTAIFAIAGGLLWLRRKFSHDGLEVKKERSEGGLIEIIIKERNAAMDDAREAWARRATDAELIGKLSAQVEALNQLNHKTNNEVHLLRLLNEKQTREMEDMRNEIRAVRDQMKTCTNCPARKVHHAVDASLLT